MRSIPLVLRVGYFGVLVSTCTLLGYLVVLEFFNANVQIQWESPFALLLTLFFLVEPVMMLVFLRKCSLARKQSRSPEPGLLDQLEVPSLPKPPQLLGVMLIALFAIHFVLFALGVYSMTERFSATNIFNRHDLVFDFQLSFLLISGILLILAVGFVLRLLKGEASP